MKIELHDIPPYAPTFFNLFRLRFKLKRAVCERYRHEICYFLLPIFFIESLLFASLRKFVFYLNKELKK